MHVLILGGNGFIGSHITDLLLKEGHRVSIFDRASEQFRPPLKDVRYIFGSFGDPFSMGEALSGIDMVYHLVNTTLPGTSNLDPVADVQDNLVSTLRLLDLMEKAGVKRILFLSSGGTVYGNPETVPIPETHPINPICSYGVVKAAIENYLYMYRHLHGLSPVVIRPSNAYGPRQGHLGIQGVISTYLHRVLQGQSLAVWGDGSIVRDYIYVEDLARLCVTAGLSGGTGTYNAGSGRGHTINDIISLISKVTGTEPEVRYLEKRSFDVKETVLDASRALKDFGWSATTDLMEGISKHWDWLKKYYGKPPL